MRMRMVVMAVVKETTLTTKFIARMALATYSDWRFATSERGNFQERLRQQAIKDKEKERTQFYTEQAIIMMLWLYFLETLFSMWCIFSNKGCGPRYMYYKRKKVVTMSSVICIPRHKILTEGEGKRGSGVHQREGKRFPVFSIPRIWEPSIFFSVQVGSNSGAVWRRHREQRRWRRWLWQQEEGGGGRRSSSK